jgi:HEAT repeat protein/ATP/ADP translocase
MTLGGRLLAIRPGEGRLVVLLAGLFAVVEAARGLGEIAADTLFLSRFGVQFLPWMYIVLGLISLVVTVAYGAGIGRARRGPFLAAVLGGSALVLGLERAAFMTGLAAGLLPVLWLTVYVVGALLLTIVWTVAGSVLDARQAKRLYPLCTSAAIAGGFAGTLSAGPLAGVLGTENLIVMVAALLVIAAALAGRIVGRFGHPVVRRAARTSLAAEMRVGFDDVRRSPLLRLVGAAYVLFAVLLFSVSFPFLGALERAFPAEADLATALGLVSAAVTGASFLVSMGLANRLYARFGIATAALLLPVVYLVGFGLWLVNFSLATAVAVRFAQQVTQRGVSNAAWTALFNVVPTERRPQVLAFIDGVPGQLGISLSGILLVVIGSLLAPTQIFMMGLLAAVACTWVVVQVRSRYGEALIRTLRAGLAEQVLEGGPGVAVLARGPHVMDGLRAALDSPAAGERRLAADLLGRLGGRAAADALVARLSDPDDEVRRAAIFALATLDGTRLLPVADRMALDPAPSVRAALAAALGDLGEDDRARAILEALLAASSAAERTAGLDLAARLAPGPGDERVTAALTDPEPLVRAAAVRAVGLAGDDRVVDALVARLDDETRVVRHAAADALAPVRAAVPALLGVLATGSDRATSAALIALAHHPDEARDPVRTWALGQIERAVTLRQRAAALPAADDGSAADFLGFFLARRAHEIEARLLSALAVLGAPDADGPIRRALRSADQDRRAQAVEALETLGDPQLGRAVVRLLDGSRPSHQPAVADILEELADDPDFWIRALARTAVGERLAARDGPGQDRTGKDVTMPDTDPTLTGIERMLVLRRVPLFGRLTPDDLQRIAAAAAERLYPAGAIVVNEGDAGDELVVIVEGGVRVVRGDGPDARLIRTYGPGDHIGELAVLRDRPRAATVIAGDEGMRGLVIGGEGLRAILEERPEAAMAMLGTLAERISEQ